MSLAVKHFYEFGSFRLDPEERTLMRQDRPVPLTPKVWEMLLVLVQNHGRIVSKEQLMNRLWPDTFVEESNLTFSIRKLRQALGDDAHKPEFVETVARRGYRFIMPVAEVLTNVDTLESRVNVRLNGANPKSAMGESLNQTALVESDRLLAKTPLGVDVAEPSALTSEVPAPSRRYLVVSGLVIIVLIVVAALVWRITSRSRELVGNQGALVSSIFPSPLTIERLTASGKSSHPVISPDGRFVAFINEASGRPSIWLKQLATDTTREIVQPGEGIGGLAFASNGESLYFARKAGGKQFNLYRVPLIGGVPAELIAEVQGTFSISPDDKQIAFVRFSADDKRCSLMLAGTDGRNEHELVVQDQPDRFNAPAWSPDGKSIAVAVGASDSGAREVQIVEVNAANGDKRALSPDRWFHIKRLLWLPDKSGLLACGAMNFGDGGVLWRISYPGGKATRISDGSDAYQTISLSAKADTAVASQVTLVSDIWIGSSNAPQHFKRITQANSDFCWTTDNHVVYASTANVRRDLWVMKSDGTEQRQLTDAGNNESPLISPNGRYVVFISNRRGSSQVWRMNIDGSNQIQLTNDKAVHSISISADGRWVVYSAANIWQLFKVAIDGGESVRLTDYISLYPAVSPDGKYIASIGRDVRNNRKLLIIPIEGGRPLKEYDFATLHLATARLQWTADGKSVIYAASSNGLTRLYKQPWSSGPPEKLVELNDDTLFDYGYSPDGKYLAVTRGHWQFDVVLFKELLR